MGQLWVAVKEMTGWVRADQIVEVRAQNSRFKGTNPDEESDVVVRVAGVSGTWDSYGGEPGGSLDQVSYSLHRAANHKDAYILARRVVDALVLYAGEAATLRIVEGEVKVQPIKPATPRD